MATHCSRKCAENYDWQAAARPERRRPSHYCYMEDRSEFGAHPPRWSALVGCSATCRLQLCTTVYKCLHGLAPQYLSELCVPVADIAGRRQLCCASRGLLYFPRYNVTSFGRRVFSYADPHAWNLQPESVQKSTSIAIFKRSLKTCLFEQITHSAH